MTYSLPERVDRSGAAKAHGAVFNFYRRLVAKAAASRTQSLEGEMSVGFCCGAMPWGVESVQSRSCGGIKVSRNQKASLLLFSRNVSSFWESKCFLFPFHERAGRPGSSEVPRNPLTRWDVSSIPANGIFLTKKIKKQK